MKKLYLASFDSGAVVSGLKTKAGKGDAADVLEPALAAMLQMITTEQIAALQRLYDRLDQADAALDFAELQLMARREALFANAYELPDGTRIFFSNDRTEAFDQYGTRIDDERMATVPIEGREGYSTNSDLERLTEEMEALEAARAELEAARQRLEPEMTPEELQEIEDDINETVAAIPDAAHYEVMQNAPENPELALSADELAMLGTGSYAQEIDGPAIQTDTNHAQHLPPTGRTPDIRQ